MPATSAFDLGQRVAQVLRELRVLHHQAERALARVRIRQQRVRMRQGRVQIVVERLVLQRLAGGALARLSSSLAMLSSLRTVSFRRLYSASSFINLPTVPSPAIQIRRRAC